MNIWVVRFAGTLQVPFAGLKVPALQPSSLQVTKIVICALQLPFVVPTIISHPHA